MSSIHRAIQGNRECYRYLDSIQAIEVEKISCFVTSMESFYKHGGDSFFQKDKSCIGPKLKLRSILLFYKDVMKKESYLLGAI